MPAPKANWANIALEYANGATSDELSAKYGVSASNIRMRATRNKWTKKVLKQAIREQNKGITQPLGLPNGALLNVASQLAAHKQEFMENGGALAAKGIKKLSKKIDDAESIKEINAIGLAGKAFTDIAKPVFGLNDQAQVNNNTQINFLTELPPEQVFLGLAGETEIVEKRAELG